VAAAAADLIGRLAGSRNVAWAIEAFQTMTMLEPQLLEEG